jgi:hypothetical protein
LLCLTNGHRILRSGIITKSERRRRRTAITSTPAGGSATTTCYIWCTSVICQARNAGNSTTRSYYAEGELVPGTPAQPYYYGSDQIGSTRRVFASTSNAPAYGYDPYGNALQNTAPSIRKAWLVGFAVRDSVLDAKAAVLTERQHCIA